MWHINSLFIGDGQEDVAGSKYLDPIYAERGSMLAKGLRQHNSGIWLLIEPLLAFTLAILAFNPLGERCDGGGERSRVN